MNAVVRLPEPRYRLAAEQFACAFCWPRISLTRMRDERDCPICAACSDNPSRKRTMPRFVVASINEDWS